MTWIAELSKTIKQNKIKQNKIKKNSEKIIRRIKDNQRKVLNRSIYCTNAEYNKKLALKYCEAMTGKKGIDVNFAAKKLYNETNRRIYSVKLSNGDVWIIPHWDKNINKVIIKHGR